VDVADGQRYVRVVNSKEAAMRRRRYVDREGSTCLASPEAEGSAPWAQVLAMQRSGGNRAVARLLSERRAEDRTSRRLQRQLVMGSDGLYTDTRDVGQPPLSFRRQGTDYAETTSGTVLSYTASHQFVSNGAYFDPFTRKWLQDWGNGWYSDGQQWYGYDGTYYRPQVQQTATASTPHASSPSPQATPQQGSQRTSAQSPSSSRPGGQMSNDDFRNMLFGGSRGSGATAQASLSLQLSRAGTLQAAIDLLRNWHDPAEALALVRSSTHGLGFKGVKQRIADRDTFVGTERGHRHAEYVTYWLYVELLQKVGASAEDMGLQQTCRKLGFDQDPRQDPDGGGGGGWGGPTKSQRGRLVL
jgi:hypothetical protein